MGRIGKLGVAVSVGVLALALGVAQAAQKQKPAPDESYVVTGTRTPVAADSATVVVDVVTSEQIAATAAADIKAALGLVPSLLVLDTGGPAGVATVSLRGSTAKQALVLVDGRRVADPQTSIFNLNDLAVPVSRIDRIEILPSPASSLYGADALGGVVNIVTRQPALTPLFVVGGGMGSDAERRLAGVAQYGIRKVGLRLDGQWRTGDGYRDNGDFDQKNVSAALAVQPDPWGLEVGWSSLERESGSPGPASLPSPTARQETSSSEAHAVLAYAPKSDWDLKAGAFWRSRTADMDDPAPPSAGASVAAAPFSSHSDATSRGLEAQLNIATGRGETYSLGGEWVEDEIDSSADGSHDTTSRGFYLQDQWRQGAWSAVIAVRRDDHSVYGEQYSPSLWMGWGKDGAKVWTAVARGYRAPSFDELYRDEEFFQGNPDLEPETAKSYEGGAEYGTAAGRVRLSVFRRDVDNLISWSDGDGDLVYRPENVGEAQVSGYEAEVVYRASDGISFPIGYQRLTAEDVATGERLSGSVRSLWRAAILSTGSKFSWSAEYVFTDRGEYENRAGSWSYSVVNASLAWRTTVKSVPFQLSVRGENLLDQEYETVEDYPEQGRSWFAELKVGL